MKTNRHHHHLSEEEVTVWLLMALLFVLTVAFALLFWLKIALAT
jgi:hypothetical protein